jgi:hypothetical protein
MIITLVTESHHRDTSYEGEKVEVNDVNAASKLLFDTNWIARFAYEDANVRESEINFVFGFQQLDPSTKAAIRARTLHRMHTKRSNDRMHTKTVKRQRLEAPTSPPLPTPPLPTPPLPLQLRNTKDNWTIAQMNGTELFKFRRNEDCTRITNVDPPFYDIDQFYSGVILLPLVVVKFLSAEGGAKFQLPQDSARAQKDYYVESRDQYPDWLGYSHSVDEAKIEAEITALQRFHDLSLGPALHSVTNYNGIHTIIKPFF